jgi:hypothetical protein
LATFSAKSNICIHTGKLLALPANIRLQRKGLPGPNTPTYCCNFVIDVIDETKIFRPVFSSATFSSKSSVCIHSGKLLSLPANIRLQRKG